MAFYSGWFLTGKIYGAIYGSGYLVGSLSVQSQIVRTFLTLLWDSLKSVNSVQCTNCGNKLMDHSVCSAMSTIKNVKNFEEKQG